MKTLGKYQIQLSQKEGEMYLIDEHLNETNLKDI